jgi:tetratricopeptide (TPR) repeat protein
MMNRVIATMLILSTTIFSGSAVASAQSSECQAVSEYFQLVDERIGEGLIEIIGQPGFKDKMELASRKANFSEMSILVLSPEEMEPITELLTVVGDTLLFVDEDDIPELATDLHQSAMELWILFPSMLRTVATGGVFGAMVFAEDMERLTQENYEAQQSVKAKCSDIVESYESLSKTMDVNFDEMNFDDIGDLEDVEPSAFHGLGYEILFFADEEDLEDGSDTNLSRSDPNADVIASQEQIVGQNPGDVEQISLLANLLANTGRMDEATTWFERALTLAPDNHSIRLDYARSLQINGLLLEAETQFRTVIENDPDNLPANYYLAMLYLDWSPPRNEEAIILLERAIEINPESFLAEQAQLELDALLEDSSP